MIFAGIAAGTFTSRALTRVIANQLWGISPTDPWTFAAVIILIGLVGLGACAAAGLFAVKLLPIDFLPLLWGQIQALTLALR